MNTHTDENIRVLVVEDSPSYRAMLVDVLDSMEGVEVVGSAQNGVIALAKIEKLHPDVITLDMEMPELDGMGVLSKLRQLRSPVLAIVVSAYTMRGGELTIRALETGAFDFITKPEGGTEEANRRRVASSLGHIMRSVRRRRTRTKTPYSLREKLKPMPPVRRTVKSRAVAIGVSTGGPVTLKSVIPLLPADLAAPVFIVQHMPRYFTKSLADNLNAESAINVTEAEHGMAVEPGKVYIAPGGKHMKIIRHGSWGMIECTDDPPENACRPSVDYLFRSLVEIYGAAVTAVMLTGMGNDGARAMRLLYDNGALTLAQDQESCIVYGMPKEAIEHGGVSKVVELAEMAAEIARSIKTPHNI